MNNFLSSREGWQSPQGALAEGVMRRMSPALIRRNALRLLTYRVLPLRNALTNFMNRFASDLEKLVKIIF